MIDFFKQRFGVVQEMDEERDMTCSFYRGLTMKPWAPPVSATDIDIDAFVREACEVHVMGRARTSDLWDAFVAWKQEADPLWQSPAGERERFVSQHVCKELSKCFRDGMKGMLLGDGYAYMRASDYATMRARCTAS